MSDTYEFLKAQKDAILAKKEAGENEWLKAAAEDIAHYKQERDLALSECERLKKINSDLCRVHNGHLVEAARLERECERLRAALGEFVSIVGTAAGFETAMTESDEVFTEFLNKQQARVDSALANANALLDAARAKP